MGTGGGLMKTGKVARAVAAAVTTGLALFALIFVVQPNAPSLQELSSVVEPLLASSSSSSAISSSSSSSASNSKPSLTGSFKKMADVTCLTGVTDLKPDGAWAHHTTQNLQSLINKNLPAQEPKPLPTDGIFCKETKRGLQVFLDAHGAKPLLKADGDFGPTTCGTLQKFLNTNGASPKLQIDGKCWTKTNMAFQQWINAQVCKNQKSRLRLRLRLRRRLRRVQCSRPVPPRPSDSSSLCMFESKRYQAIHSRALAIQHTLHQK